MKKRNYSLLVILLILSISIILSCSNSTGPEDDHSFPTAIDSVATDIMIIVYPDGGYIFGGKPNSESESFAPVYGLVLDTIELATEGSVTIDIVDHDNYLLYAEADGFYTELYKSGKGESVTIDLDAVPNVPNSITGVIFEQSQFLSDCYFDKKNIVITAVGGESITGTTDSLGRYGFSDLDQFDYILHFNQYGGANSFQILNTQATDYKDLFFTYDFIAEAPNLYLYPETTIDISVDIDFPNGGQIIVSEPPYNNGWDVDVTPEGIIDSQYDYLFYETRQPISLNYMSGWLLDGSDLENETRFLLGNLGFVGREIDDFVDYWLPRFGTTPYLAVYPQDVEEMITLTINPVPDNLLRMIFFFKPLAEPIQLEELPLPDVIQRNGFTAVEWGGILISE
ncbi:MAG: hypothetical protein GY865_06950 [candidate division Zixibacteria bacterium]|nr:hypothetical protein [candidate division Zixibacteria bacterium]